MRIFLISIILLCFLVPVRAQVVIRSDTSTISIRGFAPDAIGKYKKDPQFQYERVMEPPRSIWARFWAWVWSRISELFNTSLGSNLFYWGILPLAMLVFGYFIFRVVGMRVGVPFGKENKENPLAYTQEEENIHKIDFDKAIQQAAEEKNFKLAVRLLYLQALKNLSDTGKINWQINKTNREYGYELGGTNLGQPFGELTLLFERNWYGNIPPREMDFGGIKNLFTDFNNRIKG